MVTISSDKPTVSRRKGTQPSRVPTERPGPTGGKRDRNRAERTQRIATAARALFVERGIEGVTIDDIVGAAGMAKGSFYRYFGSKEELVEALLAPVAAAFDAAMDAAVPALAVASTDAQIADAYLRLGLTLGAALTEHRDTVLLYLQECRAPGVAARRPVRALADAVGRRSIALTETAHAYGLLRDVPPAVSALAVVGAVERLLFDALNGAPVGEPAEVVRSLITIVLDGILAPSRRPTDPR